jgi:hypothetical protein
MRVFAQTLAATAIILMLTAAAALACTPLPVELRTDFINGSAANLMSEVQANINHVVRVRTGSPQVVQYEWVGTNPDFECHDKETLRIQVAFTYRNAQGRFCYVTGVVTKTEGFYEGAPKPDYVITALTNSCATNGANQVPSAP